MEGEEGKEGREGGKYVEKEEGVWKRGNVKGGVQGRRKVHKEGGRLGTEESACLEKEREVLKR